MIDIESKIISFRADTNDYRLCLTREDIDEIKNAWNDGYYQGATQMEEAKQIIIDSLLKQMEQIRAEVIDEFAIALKELPQDDRELYKYAIGDEYSFDEYVDWVAEQLKEQNK